MADRFELVDVEVEAVLRETDKAFLLKVEGDEVWVGKSKISNLDEFDEYWARPVTRTGRGPVPTLTVQRWLALENGWIDDD